MPIAALLPYPTVIRDATHVTFPFSSHKKLAIKTKSGAVNGIKHSLKKSQSYPAKFGQQVAKIVRKLYLKK